MKSKITIILLFLFIMSFPALLAAILQPVMFSFHAFVIRWLLVKPSSVTLIAELNFCRFCKSLSLIDVENKLRPNPNPLEKSFFIS